MNFEEYLGKYEEHLEVLNFSRWTVKGRAFYLKIFFRWLKDMEIRRVTGVKRETMRDYQVHLAEQVTSKGEPWSVSTQVNALVAVKGFFKFLCEEDYLVGDPARSIPYPKRPKRLPRSILTAGEVKKILGVPDIKTALGYRDRAILELLYSTGLRREELNRLQVTDVDWEEGFVRVNQGKGGKDRVVPLGKIACRYLENYVKSVRPMLLKRKRTQELFISLKGGPLSRNVLGEIVKRCVGETGLRKKVSPHTFRHTCATLMLKNRANLRHVQELLGHSSLNTTQVYTAVTVADLKAIHKKCHPREREVEK
jgi:integrase/recombinase XerD